MAKVTLITYMPEPENNCGNTHLFSQKRGELNEW